MASISSDTVKDLKTTIDSYTSKLNGVPGLVCSIVNKDGTSIFEHASGKRGVDSAEPMTSDTLLWFASCTKLITAIAAMQLVEQGKVGLDDGDEVERHLPELKEVLVLEEQPDGSLTMVEKKQKITLRMLLSHTAGFGYSFSNAKLKRWSEPVGISEVSSEEYDLFAQPLVNQPGEKWEYGVNMDWAGRLIERVSGLSLGDYFHKFIFAPIGISKLTFFPSAEAKKNLASLHQRNDDGAVRLTPDGHVCHRPLVASKPEEIKSIVNAGGHGLFGTPSQYCEVISVLLNHGIHPKTGTQLLKRETMEEMFKNQIPQWPDFARDQGLPSKPEMIKYDSETYPQPGNPAQGWGLSFFSLLHPGPTGRAAGTVWWSGVANLIWWADIKNGIGGMIAAQILPYGDDDVFDCHEEVETKLYAELRSTS